MSHLIRRKHASLRLQAWDYSSAAAYFLTLNVQDRESLFGEIIDGHMVLNSFGRIAEDIWNDIPIRYPDVHIDAFVVMPDHIHGIIVVDRRNGPAFVGGIHESPLRQTDPQASTEYRQQRRGMTIPKIVGYFRMNVAKQVNQIRMTPGTRVWQREYYDRVIRDDAELERVRHYIRENPLRWWERYGNRLGLNGGL